MLSTVITAGYWYVGLRTIITVGIKASKMRNEGETNFLKSTKVLKPICKGFADYGFLFLLVTITKL